MNSKDTRLLMAAVVGAVLALLVGYFLETRENHRLYWTLAWWMERGSSWVVWVTAGAVLGVAGYTLLNRDDKQP